MDIDRTGNDVLSIGAKLSAGRRTRRHNTQHTGSATQQGHRVYATRLVIITLRAFCAGSSTIFPNSSMMRGLFGISFLTSSMCACGTEQDDAPQHARHNNRPFVDQVYHRRGSPGGARPIEFAQRAAESRRRQQARKGVLQPGSCTRVSGSRLDELLLEVRVLEVPVVRPHCMR